MKLLVLLISVICTCLGNTISNEIIPPHLDVKDSAIHHVLQESLSLVDNDRKRPIVGNQVLDSIVLERGVKLPTATHDRKQIQAHRKLAKQQRKLSRKELREKLRLARLHRKTLQKSLRKNHKLNAKLDKLHGKPTDKAAHGLSEVIKAIDGKHKDGKGSDLSTDYIKEHLVDISKPAFDISVPVYVHKTAPTHRMLKFPVRTRDGKVHKVGSTHFKGGPHKNKGKHVKLPAKPGNKRMKNAHKRLHGKKKLNRNNKNHHGYVKEGESAHQALSKM
ncbi:uncharacterized protein LOC127855161 [Dreissena polymorpha]|uniref:uncharacterized protein LOC127855161 n=1 Tax=Dreissena polymorpha TaxID=45954 RepID=UPI0022643578|nr:uncharacterized protein LOC127855161 [Dreissena polymorpha]XP_052246531.1 uncharacterized protein LOC127855161 [Dreissena polymorpha]XP_052246532.1 uncharacterized protein LOC127855161 [Dreissena polymorpha]